MSAITIYDNTGRVLRAITCPDDHVDLQLQEGESYLSGTYPGNQFYIANGAAVAMPASPGDGFTFDYAAKTWVAPVLTADQQKAALAAACSASIAAGFMSSALGAPYHYPATDVDQRNLLGSILASTLPGTPAGWTTPFWCADAAGVWAFRQHTTAQIQQVGLDAKAAVVAAQTAYATAVAAL